MASNKRSLSGNQLSRSGCASIVGGFRGLYCPQPRPAASVWKLSGRRFVLGREKRFRCVSPDAPTGPAQRTSGPEEGSSPSSQRVVSRESFDGGPPFSETSS